ncbi:tRNA lysidine(34) synthetase TilS [Microbulbifer guangxiensis]|uniref:tRNA lysidine(34) synthetase TilS n=1 Tax=Microbulbifer guangxiensis TaxID=2904249 RepID=UPI001F006A50|nr:tRNA lysidine(34) synthetase TilS [Microbulbifer guangxiensis]
MATLGDDTLTLQESLRAFLARYPCRGRRWVALSGGLDSTVLLHLLSADGEPVSAVHVHHGLSPNADDWAEHCAELTDSLGVPLLTKPVAVDASGGVEAGARDARYRVFEQLLQPGDQLLLAHHGDDQVETFFLRLLRGAGPQGLSGMRSNRPLGQGQLLRPLLDVARRDLESYAREHELTWIEDESNLDVRFDRNYLRARVLPLLHERWPLRQRIRRATQNLNESASLLRELADSDLQACRHRAERLGESIALDPFHTFSAGRRRNVLRGWTESLGGAWPNAQQLAELEQQLASAEADRLPAVPLGRLVARRFRDRLFLTPVLPEVPEDFSVSWDGRHPLLLPGEGCLGPLPGWPATEYSVRFRRGGERARPLERQHSQTLKKLLQEYGLEPWLRERVPLIFEGERLLAVGDLFLCEGWGSEAPEALPDWRPLAFFD